jgi:hypothetical protein
VQAARSAVLAEFELVFIYIQGLDPGLESRRWNSKFRRRSGRTGNPASGLGERCLDSLQLASRLITVACKAWPRRPSYGADEPQASAPELDSQDAVLFAKVFDRVLLLLIYPSIQPSPDRCAARLFSIGPGYWIWRDRTAPCRLAENSPCLGGSKAQ